MWSTSKRLAAVAGLLLVFACTATPAPTPTPTATRVPTVAPTPTVARATPTHEPEQIPEGFNARIAAIRQKMELLEPVWTVYFHGGDWRTPGRNTVMAEVFELLKLENIATHEGYREIDPETVVDAEPDIIIADSVESIVKNPALSGLHMVQDAGHVPHHIFVLSGGLSFDVDDHHFMDAVEKLAAFVYPDVFAESDATGDGHSHDHGHGHGDEDEAENEGSDGDHDEGQQDSHGTGKKHSH